MCVRNRAELHFPLSPINPLKPLPGAYARGTVPFPCAPNEYINWMLVTLVDQHCNRAALNHVYAPTLESKPLVGEIADRNSKPSPAVEPAIHDALIVGGDAVDGTGL